MEVSILFTQNPIVVPPAPGGSREMGAVVEFHGVVRELERGVPLSALRSEAYEPMAVRQLHAIFAALNRETPVHSVQFIHRLGWVSVGETSLYLRITSSHRGEAFEFCKESINAMKRDVPIWKSTHPPECPQDLPTPAPASS